MYSGSAHAAPGHRACPRPGVQVFAVRTPGVRSRLKQEVVRFLGLKPDNLVPEGPARDFATFSTRMLRGRAAPTPQFDLVQPPKSRSPAVRISARSRVRPRAISPRPAAKPRAPACAARRDVLRRARALCAGRRSEITAPAHAWTCKCLQCARPECVRASSKRLSGFWG